MKKRQFDELLESVHEGGAILRAMTPTPETLREAAHELSGFHKNKGSDFVYVSDITDLRAHAYAWEAEIGRRLNCEMAIREKEARLLEVERAAEEAKRNHIERKHIDATPDEGYPLRVLRAYRADCDLLWAGSSADDTDTPLTVALNKMQKQRAAILDKAIAALAGEK